LGRLDLLEKPSTLPGLLVLLDHKVMQVHRAPLARPDLKEILALMEPKDLKD
jgi:hypothetical protein